MKDWIKANVKWVLAILGTIALAFVGIAIKNKKFQKARLDLDDAKENADRERKKQKVASLEKAQTKIEKVKKEIEVIDGRRETIRKKREHLETAEDVADAWNND